MRNLLKSLLAVACLSNLAAAQPLVFGTGTNAAGGRVTTAGNDLHYTLAGTSAKVVTQNFDGTYPINPWINPASPGVTSNWISRTTNAVTEEQPVTFSFTTTFNLTNYQIGAINLSGRWATDNSGVVLLNGHQIGTSSSLSAFSAFGTSNALFFLPGLNVLTFNVTNAGGPMGLIVDNPVLTGVRKVPELNAQAALLPLTFVGVGLLLTSGKRRRSWVSA